MVMLVTAELATISVLLRIDDSTVGMAQPTANDGTPDTTDKKVLDEVCVCMCVCV